MDPSSSRIRRRIGLGVYCRLSMPLFFLLSPLMVDGDVQIAMGA